MINTLFIFSAGITISFGILTISIWLLEKSNRSYLFFSLVGIFSGVNFFFAQPQFQGEFNKVFILANAVYWAAFPWFISEYTGYRKSKFPALISILLAITYLGFILDWSFWNLMAHASLILIVTYSGLATFKKLKFKKNPFLFTIYILFGLLAFEEIAYANFNFQLWFRSEIDFMPLDFYGLLFTLVMGMKMVSDVKKKYLFERELKEKEFRWGTFIENLKLIVLRVNKDGLVEYVNPYFEEITSYKIADILGKDWFEVMPPESEKVVRKSILVGNSNLFDSKNRIITKSGESKWILWSDIPIKQSDGTPAGMFSIGYDITEKEKNLNQIQLLKDKLEKEKLELEEKLNVISKDHTEIIGESDAINYVINKAQQVAGTSTTVLIEGETGVGKELFANLIHSKSSRSTKPFIKINCAAIPSELIESELFGHEKGSFTSASYQKKGVFELADGGTLFLDEVSEIPLSLQPKLLRVLQSGEYSRVGGSKTLTSDVRIISATNQSLSKQVEKGTFREDLFYRLNVYPITVPTLSSRKEDIPLLVKFFIAKIGDKLGKKFESLSKHDMAKLTQYHWPGNIRELENIVERSVINSVEPTLQIEGLKKNNNQYSSKFAVATLEEMEKEFIIQTLEVCNWRINGPDGAADILNINPNTLRSKMKKLEINRPVTS